MLKIFACLASGVALAAEAPAGSNVPTYKGLSLGFLLRKPFASFGQRIANAESLLPGRLPLRSGSMIVKILCVVGLLVSFTLPLAQADIDTSLLSTSTWNPEPSTMALLGAGLIFLSLVVRSVSARLQK
jgi:hypothetical protein